MIDKMQKRWERRRREKHSSVVWLFERDNIMKNEDALQSQCRERKQSPQTTPWKLKTLEAVLFCLCNTFFQSLPFWPFDFHTLISAKTTIPISKTDVGGKPSACWEFTCTSQIKFIIPVCGSHSHVWLSLRTLQNTFIKVVFVEIRRKLSLISIQWVTSQMLEHFNSQTLCLCFLIF